MSTRAPERCVIGLDAHPDTCSAAGLSGADAGTAEVKWVDHPIPVERLEKWAAKRVGPHDTVVIEASGNTFELADRLQKAGCHVVVLESLRAGQIRKTYCNTDKISAVKIARVFLSGLAVVVWKPDEKTRQRRELFRQYQRSVIDATRYRNRISGWLNGHGIKRPTGVRLTQPSGRTWMMGCREWSAMQRLLIEQMLEELVTAHQYRKRLRRIIALEVVRDPGLLHLVRLFGVAEITAFALGAFVGEIHRFRTPKQLVAYVGLNPRVQLSGKGGYIGSTGRHGRKELRATLIEAAQNLLRYDNPLKNWGWKLLIAKGRNVAAVAVARKLTVSCWYLMMGRFTPLQQVGPTLRTKITKMVAVLGKQTVTQLGYSKLKQLEECLHQQLMAS